MPALALQLALLDGVGSLPVAAGFPKKNGAFAGVKCCPFFFDRRAFPFQNEFVRGRGRPDVSGVRQRAGQFVACMLFATARGGQVWRRIFRLGGNRAGVGRSLLSHIWLGCEMEKKNIRVWGGKKMGQWGRGAQMAHGQAHVRL